MEKSLLNSYDSPPGGCFMVQALDTSGINSTRLKVVSRTANDGIPQKDQQTSVPDDAVSVSINVETAKSKVYNRHMIMEGQPSEDNALLRDYVVKLLEEQGLAVKFTIDSDRSVDFNTMTPEEARELISEDGYFGIEKTSDRIVEFAISSAGNDPAKLDQIKAAVLDGFRQAEEAFGGVLADISYDTLDAIMEKLDKWADQTPNTETTAA